MEKWSIGHNGPGQLGSRCLSGSHVPFQQWTNSYWAITRGDVTVSYITKMQTDKIQKQPFIHLGHGFSYISPQTVSDKTLIWTFAVWAIKHEKYNLSSFHSVLFTCTWVPTYCTSVKDMKERAHRWRGGDVTERLVKESSKFIPLSDSPLSCCQHHLQIMTSELSDIYRLILK